MSTDPEFLAMRSIGKTIDALDNHKRRRVKAWLIDKLNEPAELSTAEPAMDHEGAIPAGNGQDVEAHA